MKEKIIKLHHPNSIISLLSLLFLVACTGSGASVLPMIFGPTVTPNLAPSPTLTPFAPQVGVATNTPTTPTELMPNTPTLPPIGTASFNTDTSIVEYRLKYTYIRYYYS